MPTEEHKTPTADIVRPRKLDGTSRQDLLKVLEGGVGEMDLDSKGYRDDRSEKNYDGSSEWLESHTARTPHGSLVVGTLHNTDAEATGEIRKHILPRVIDGARDLLTMGKRMVFIAEGGIHGVSGSEQEMIADELDSVSSGTIEHDTWDDQNVEICSFDDDGRSMGVGLNLSLVRKLTEKFGDEKVVEAALYAMMRGHGEEFSITDEAKQYLESIEIDPTDQDSLFKVTFPAIDEEDSILAQICREYNRLRQENMLRKIKDVEMAGGVAIVTPGASHAYSLKPILEQGLY